MLKNMFKEFKEFAFKGNVLDMAIGVVMGGAFGKIVTSIVNDIIMPFVSIITGGTKFSAMKYVITPAVIENGTIISEEVAFTYGNLIQQVIDFTIIAFCIFLMVKVINKLRNTKEEKPVEEAKGPTSEELLTEIRDLIKNEKK